MVEQPRVHEVFFVEGRIRADEDGIDLGRGEARRLADDERLVGYALRLNLRGPEDRLAFDQRYAALGHVVDLVTPFIGSFHKRKAGVFLDVDCLQGIHEKQIAHATILSMI